MAFPNRQAAIVGMYTTEQARSLERTSASLEIEAIKGALTDAGLGPGDVHGMVPMAASGEAPTMATDSRGGRLTGGQA
jgi:hypothetical protein